MRLIRTFCGSSRRIIRVLADAVGVIRAAVRRADGHVEGSRSGDLGALYIAGAVVLVVVVVDVVVVAVFVAVVASAVAAAPVAAVALELEAS